MEKEREKLDYEKRLEKNITKFAWFKIFTKRVYLPLIAVHLVNVGLVTVKEIALISAISAVAVITLQVPSGYFADRFGNKRAILLGSVIASVSPLFYIFSPNFIGGLLASILFFSGFAFLSGAVEAFMHDTLVALKREKDYSKVMGRAQSYGLIGNVVLIALVPATYAIHPNIPFFLGFISLLAMLGLAISFTYPKDSVDIKEGLSFKGLLRIANLQNMTLILLAGFTAGVVERSALFRELFFQDLGIAVALYGFLVAIGSLLGAILGRFLHILHRLPSNRFYLLDLVFLSLCLVVAGTGVHPALTVTGFILLSGYGRVRMIVYQAKLLERVTHRYKATLLSALATVSELGTIGVAFFLATMVGFVGYATSYVYLGLVTLGVSMILFLLIALEGKRRE